MTVGELTKNHMQDHKIRVDDIRCTIAESIFEGYASDLPEEYKSLELVTIYPLSDDTIGIIAEKFGVR